MERYVIHVTKECNMNCLYCYEMDKISTYTWEEISSFIENIIKEHKDDSKYSVEFLGGEPLLEFDYIKKAVELFLEKDPAHVDHFVITTNGTIVTRAVIDLLKAHNNILFSASLDGGKEANKYRTFTATNENSFDRVIFNLKKLMMAGIPANQISIHMVTHPFNVTMVSESIRYFYSIGIRSISVGTVENTMIIDEIYEGRLIRELGYISEEIADGSMKDLRIDLFHDFDPNSHDTRIYIKDDSGKTIGESYGRASQDITDTNIYKSIETTSILKDRIFNLRKTIYDNFWRLNKNV